MRYLPLALLASASSALAHPRPPPPHELLVPPPRPTPPTRPMVCSDSPTSSSCEVTSLTIADVHELERRSDHLVMLRVRADATQADFDKLAAVRFLTYVVIDSPVVHDLHALARFEHLVTLGIDVSAAGTLGEVSGESLQALTIGGCGKLADLSTLAHLHALVTLHLSGTACLEITRFDGIEQLPKLAALRVGTGTIGDAWALAKATSIRNLEIAIGPIPFAAIAHLQLDTLQLNLLHATEAELTTFEHLANLTGLTSLDIMIDREPHLPKLTKLTALTVRMFGAERVVDLSFVKTMPHLKSLSVSYGKRADLAPLASLHDVERIEIEAICEVDVKPLAKLAKLQFLFVSARAEHVIRRRGLTISRWPNTGCMPDTPPATLAK